MADKELKRHTTKDMLITVACVALVAFAAGVAAQRADDSNADITIMPCSVLDGYQLPTK